MNVKFSIKEKLYSICHFEIKGVTQDEVEEVLDEIGENVSADELYYKLADNFGYGNVSSDGIGDIDSIDTENEYEFFDWEETK